MKLIVANWKMNPGTQAEALGLLRITKEAVKNSHNVKAVICSPFVWLSALAGQDYGPVELGAQDLFWMEKGAFTGEVSPVMLKNIGCKFVIVGHSERRKYLDETDEMINEKVKAGLMAGLKVILCVGEPRVVREKGFVEAEHFVKEQLTKDLRGIEILGSKIKNLILTYEPIWAISTAKDEGGQNLADTPANAVAMIEFIRQQVSSLNFKPLALYGGSVNKDNVASFVGAKGIDGVLVGGASIDRKVFPKLIKSIKLS